MNKVISSLFGVFLLSSTNYATAEYAYSYTPKEVELTIVCPNPIYCEPTKSLRTPFPTHAIFSFELEANKSYTYSDLLGFGFAGDGIYNLNLSLNSGIFEFNVTTDNDGNIVDWDVLDYQRPYILRTTTNLDSYSFDSGPFYGSGSTTDVSTWVKSYVVRSHTPDVSVVPEPEAFAMMLLGLLGIGFAARKKHS